MQAEKARPLPVKRVLREILKTQHDRKNRVLLLTVLWNNSTHPEYVCLPEDALRTQMGCTVKAEREQSSCSFIRGELPSMSESATIKEYQSLSDIKWLSHPQADSNSQARRPTNKE